MRGPGAGGWLLTGSLGWPAPQWGVFQHGCTGGGPAGATGAQAARARGAPGPGCGGASTLLECRSRIRPPWEDFLAGRLSAVRKGNGDTAGLERVLMLGIGSRTDCRPDQRDGAAVKPKQRSPGHQDTRPNPTTQVPQHPSSLHPSSFHSPAQARLTMDPYGYRAVDLFAPKVQSSPSVCRSDGCYIPAPCRRQHLRLRARHARAMSGDQQEAPGYHVQQCSLHTDLHPLIRDTLRQLTCEQRVRVSVVGRASVPSHPLQRTHPFIRLQPGLHQHHSPGKAAPT